MNPLCWCTALGAESQTWGFVVPGLAESFHVVAYDRRGHGNSGGPPEAGTVHDDMADLAALIEDLGIAPVNLVANSYGACIALRLTIERPDLVRRALSSRTAPRGVARWRSRSEVDLLRVLGLDP